MAADHNKHATNVVVGVCHRRGISQRRNIGDLWFRLSRTLVRSRFYFIPREDKTHVHICWYNIFSVILNTTQKWKKINTQLDRYEDVDIEITFGNCTRVFVAYLLYYTPLPVCIRSENVTWHSASQAALPMVTLWKALWTTADFSK